MHAKLFGWSLVPEKELRRLPLEFTLCDEVFKGNKTTQICCLGI